MGVRKALELTLSEANKKDPRPLYTFGPLIHNTQVLELLSAKGIKIVNSIQDLASMCKDGSQARVIIRAHGIPPQTRAMLRQSHLQIKDATCPKVAQVQALIKYHTSKGRKAVIVGDQEHPEVIGLKGYSKTEAIVIQKKEDLALIPPETPIVVVAQTTQDALTYKEISQAVKERFPNAVIFDTICNATQERQAEVRDLCRQVDAVVVIGGKESGNTKRLVQIARECNSPAFHVETGVDLDRAKLSQFQVIGVTAGASTPSWLIKDVLREIEAIKGARDSHIRTLFYRVTKFLVLSNLAAWVSTFFFAFAAAETSLTPPSIPYSFMASLYLFSMHVLNRYLDKGASAYSEPERASFLRKHRTWLLSSALLANMGSLGIAFTLGKIPFITLFTLTALGLLYSIPLVPSRFSERFSFSKIKDIPGSKGTSEALAWVAVMIFIPLVGEGFTQSGSDAFELKPALIASIVVFLLAFIRSALFEIFQIQGDLIVGRETLPIVLGKDRTLKLLKILLALVLILLFLSQLADLLTSSALVMLLPTIGLSVCLFAYQKRGLDTAILYEALIETSFLLAGLLVLAAWYLRWPW